MADEDRTEDRRYRSDDRDLPDDDNDLLISQGGNGDWYVSIVRHGAKIGPTVRVTTSGAPRALAAVAPALAKLYCALPPEAKP